MSDTPDSMTATPSADAGAELAPGTDVGGYVIDAKIGEGGMGVVYGAKQPRIGKRVAIKILSRAYCGDPTVVARFEQEARFVNAIRHPNIVDVFQFGELPDKRSFFVMEWLDGEPLTARIERGPVPADEAMEILDVICDALQAAHEQNVIHRDLKSDNVYLVTSRNKRTVKLLDFGLAKLSSRGLEDAPIGTTKSGILVGTPAYMSPEQARGKPVDGRTDVYALGVLAYKMLTGALPFRADNAMDLIVLQLNAPPPQPIKLAPKTPQQLSRLVVRMMAKVPEERPTLAEIRELFAELRASAVPPRAKRETNRQAKPQADEPRQEPSFGTPRLSEAEREARPDAPPPAKNRTTTLLISAAALLLGVIATIIVLLAKKSDESGVPVAAAAPAGSAAIAPVTAPPPAPAPVAEPTTIEFADDQVGSAGSAARKRPDKEHDVPEGTTEAVLTPVAPKPGKILVMLQNPSTIKIDGKVVAQSAKAGTFEVSPGDHQLEVIAADREPVSRSVTLDPGGSAVISIADDVSGGAPAAAPAPAPAPAATPTPTPPPAPSPTPALPVADPADGSASE